jgi:hypothetical protein
MAFNPQIQDLKSTHITTTLRLLSKLWKFGLTRLFHHAPGIIPRNWAESMDMTISGNSRKQFPNFEDVKMFSEKREIFREMKNTILKLLFFLAAVGTVKQGSFEHLWVGLPFRAKKLIREIRNNTKLTAVRRNFILSWNRKHAKFHFETFSKIKKDSEFCNESSWNKKSRTFFDKTDTWDKCFDSFRKTKKELEFYCKSIQNKTQIEFFFKVKQRQIDFVFFKTNARKEIFL